MSLGPNRKSQFNQIVFATRAYFESPQKTGLRPEETGGTWQEADKVKTAPC